MSLFYPYSHHHHQRLDSFINRSYHPFGSYFQQQPALSSLDDTTRQLSRWMNHAHKALSSNASSSRSSSTPSFTVEDAENAYIIEGSIPGIHEDDVTIHVVDNTTLTVRGQTETIKRGDSTSSNPEEQQMQNQIATTSGQDNPVNTDQTANTSIQPSPPEASQAIITSLADQPLQYHNTSPVPSQSPRYRVTHRAISQFQRTFTLPDGIDRTSITTKFAGEKLRIVVSKPNTNTKIAEAGLEAYGVDSGVESQVEAQAERCGHDTFDSTGLKSEHEIWKQCESDSQVSVDDDDDSSNVKSKPQTKGR